MVTVNPLRVTYFTIVPLAGPPNGGLICCRNNLERLHADPGIDCFALVAAAPSVEAGTLEYFRSKGIDGAFVRFKEPDRGPDGLPVSDKLPGLKRRWPFPHEIEGWEQDHLDGALEAHIMAHSPDVIVVDYLPTALYVPNLYKSHIPVVTITLNREADFYQDQIDLGLSFYGRIANRPAGFRLRVFERLAYRRSRAVISIGRYDLPHGLFRPKHRYWISPYLDPVPKPWTYTGSKSLFFVGNRGHYPNGKAIEWIATQFAPALARLDPALQIRIVGADANSVPSHWLSQNIQYLGLADDAQVRALFRSEDLFIAPIENNFGAKFKVAEAISYGTPLLATENAMSGVSFLPWLPAIELERPMEAAATAHALVEDAEALQVMSVRMQQDTEYHAQSHTEEWSRILHHVLD